MHLCWKISLILMVHVCVSKEGGPEKLPNCCISIRGDEVTDPIIGFRLQRYSPPCVKAVILETQRGLYCVDWKPRWVKEKIRQFITQKRLSETTPPPPTSSSSISVLTHVEDHLKLTTADNEHIKLSTHDLRETYTCCKSVSSKEVTDPIISFRLQRSSPPCVKAVILETQKRLFCVDWRQSWVKNQILQFIAHHH